MYKAALLIPTHMPNKNIGSHCQQTPQVLALWHVRKQADGTVLLSLFCLTII